MAKVVDLFAGVGGLSLGAARAGFELAGAVELDPIALATHALNFPRATHLPLSVSELTGNSLLRLVSLREGELDGLIGGPPCQGFSAIGRRHPEDERNDLFFHFFRLVREVQPKFFVAENVPGIMDEKHRSLRERALGHISGDYRIEEPLKAVATDYGAPTTRTRFFFIGIHRSVLANASNRFAISLTSNWKRKAPKIGTALKGLPLNIRSNWLTEPQGWRSVVPVVDEEHSHFFDRAGGLIPENVGDPFSVDQYMKNRLVSGCLGTRHSEDVKKRYGELRHGARDPISRSPRLDPNGYCPTLRAGTGSDRGSYQAVRPIHPTRPRVITPREAARLQGFPDWFRFHATKWHSFRQIGNSVSPIVAEAILSEIYVTLFPERTPEPRKSPLERANGCEHALICA